LFRMFSESSQKTP